jgi:serine/threonine protein kinase
MTDAFTWTSKRFARYELVQRLGVGGMGEVALAIDRGGDVHDDKLVALKVLREDFAKDDEAVAYFLSEARLVARLAHKNIVGIYRLGEHQGRYYISMEYVRGGSLAELQRATKTHGPIPLGAALSAIVQLCRGAHAAHELKDGDRPLNIVHRDITPHNVMVDVDGVCKLLDFGIAVNANDVTDDLASGKPSYLAPEQARREGVDRRTDVFGIGVVLWELLAGRKRLRYPDAASTLQAVVEGVSPSLVEHRDDLPVGVVMAINRALATARKDRFDTAADFAKALLDAAGDVAVGEGVLAATVRTHLADHLRERATELMSVESTLHVRAPLTRPADDAAPTIFDSALGPEGSEPTQRTSGDGEGDGDALAQPLRFPVPLPTVALGPNFEICADAHTATVRVWSRPDLSRDEGAESAAMILSSFVRLFEDVRTLRGMLIDGRSVHGVLGTKTMGLIEVLFRTAEARGLSVVILSRDPIQRLDFAELAQRAALRRSFIVASAAEAVRLVIAP